MNQQLNVVGDAFGRKASSAYKPDESMQPKNITEDKRSKYQQIST